MSTEHSSPGDALRQQLDDWLAPILEELQQAELANQWPRVEQLCKQALQRDGENWGLWQRLAQSYEARSELAQAETLWRHLTQRFSSRPEPYLALAALQRLRGAPDAARVVLEEAERRVGNSDALRRSLGVIDDPWALGEAVPQLASGASAQELARALQLVQQHLDAGRFAEAEAVLEQILKAKPQAVRVHLSLAQLRQRRGERDLLIAQLEPLLSDPQVTAGVQERLPLTLLLVQALLSQQLWLRADLVLAPLAADPESCGVVELLLARAEVALGRGDEQAAQQWLERCLALQPAQSTAHRLLGVVALRLGDWSSAMASFTNALALEPNNSEIAEMLEKARFEQLWWRAETELKRGAWAAAAECYRQLLESSPGHADALARLDLLASLGPQALVEAAESCLSTAPDSAATQLDQFRAQLDRFEAQLKMLGVLMASPSGP